MGDQGGCEQEPNPVGGCPGGYGSVDMFSWRTVAWEPVSAEEGDLDHPPGTSRPDARASATQGVVKPDRATANRAPGAPGKDEALWELVYFFDNMDNPAGAPCKETGEPSFTRQHLVAMFMDLILFACGLAAPRARLPSRACEALSPSLMVPRPTQFFQGIAEQGYMWQNVPYGIDFTGDISMYGRSGTFWSWGKDQRGAWFAALCHDDPDRRLGLVCVCTIKECLCLRHLGHTDNHFQSKMIDPTLFQLFRVAGFPTCTGLAVDPGIRAYVTDPQPPSPACTAAGEAHASPHSAVGVSGPQPASTPSRPPHTPLRAGCSPVPSRPSVGTSTPRRRGRTAPPPTPTGPSSAGRPACDAVPLWLPAPPHMGADMCGQAATTEACLKPAPSAPPEQTGTLSLQRPPGEDAQAVRSSEPHLIVGGRLTPPFDTLDLALLHVVQHAARLGGLSLGERECVVTRLCGMPVPPQGFLGVVAHLCLLVDQTLLTPWDFDLQGDSVLPWLLPWARILILWVREDMRVAPGSDHRGAIVNMYLELSRMEWWALSDWREVLSEWCKGASMPV
ncbi:hypothetical protein K439DRAFT_1616743 [Ramaria rubella]|nr:hypothetical protein K439DRAFT_1616743 [Ramaria rubella]